MRTKNKYRKQDYDVHLGQNVQRIRQMFALKQEALADRAGFMQQYISRLERRPNIAEPVLERLAAALNVTVDFIKEFDIDNPFSKKNIFFGDTRDQISIVYSQVTPLLKVVKKMITDERARLKTLDEIETMIMSIENSMNTITSAILEKDEPE